MKIAQPCLISSLGSHTTWPPLSLALRISPSGLTATVAFSLPTLAGGWTVGIQEVRVANDGEVVQSRLAFADEVGFHPFQDDRTAISNISTLSIPPEPQSRRILKSSPTSLSYSHPYLLLSHSDNTLTLYLASSSDNELAITSGIRLWGHTSSVSGAQVGDRGRAVSVSAIGDEIRVWELEGKVFGQGNKPKQPARLASVQVRPGNENTVEETMESSNVAKGFHIGDPSLDLTKSCVGFDRERIVVLKEDMNGFQTLITYDFT
ncbi:hypothetical protein MMC25_008150 [Agyrium rufum]|nr:hypothetical protein [Agyrium rufum]